MTEAVRRGSGPNVLYLHSSPETLKDQGFRLSGEEQAAGVAVETQVAFDLGVPQSASHFGHDSRLLLVVEQAAELRPQLAGQKAYRSAHLRSYTLTAGREAE